MTVRHTGDTRATQRAYGALRNPHEFMEQVGNLAVRRAKERLQQVLRQDTDVVRTGELSASINVLSVSDNEVRVGTPQVYARQVHFGGTIRPRLAKALAIPVDPKLKRSKIGPREYPKELEFRPAWNKPNVFGVLVEAEKKQDKGKGSKTKKAKARKPVKKRGGVKYALAWWVIQEPRPYLYWDRADIQTIYKDILPFFLEYGEAIE